MDKVKITREQASVLEDMKAKGSSLNEIIERHVHKDHMRVNGFGSIQIMSTDTLIRALYIGYEVEETPEDKVRQYYKDNSKRDKTDTYSTAHRLGTRDAIITTLDLLGIKIEGVNA